MNFLGYSSAVGGEFASDVGDDGELIAAILPFGYLLGLTYLFMFALILFYFLQCFIKTK